MSTKKRVGVLRFPGTNCDWDIWNAVKEFGGEPAWLWHQDQFAPAEYESFILPGGFSYGDYLRSGALAAHSPSMNSLREAAKKGFPIFGICNGFQILCEAQLLPGVLLRNIERRFIDKMIRLKIANPHARFGSTLAKNEVVEMPIAHADGRYHVAEGELKQIEDNGQIFCTYEENPNGSAGNIAGLMSKEKNVVGMMPHPERALHLWMGSKDGRKFF